MPGRIRRHYHPLPLIVTARAGQVKIILGQRCFPRRQTAPRQPFFPYKRSGQSAFHPIQRIRINSCGWLAHRPRCAVHAGEPYFVRASAAARACWASDSDVPRNSKRSRSLRAAVQDAIRGSWPIVAPRSARPANSGAASLRASRTLPCCSTAPRKRRWALPRDLRVAANDVAGRAALETQKGSVLARERQYRPRATLRSRTRPTRRRASRGRSGRVARGPWPTDARPRRRGCRSVRRRGRWRRRRWRDGRPGSGGSRRVARGPRAIWK